MRREQNILPGMSCHLICNRERAYLQLLCISAVLWVGIPSGILTLHGRWKTADCHAGLLGGDCAGAVVWAGSGAVSDR